MCYRAKNPGQNNPQLEKPPQMTYNANANNRGLRAYYYSAIAHEIEHLHYSSKNIFNLCKWRLIRDEAEKRINRGSPNLLNLGDKLGNNGACSEGSGHEMFNPENAATCTH